MLRRPFLGHPSLLVRLSFDKSVDRPNSINNTSHKQGSSFGSGIVIAAGQCKRMVRGTVVLVESVIIVAVGQGTAKTKSAGDPMVTDGMVTRERCKHFNVAKFFHPVPGFILSGRPLSLNIRRSIYGSN